MMLDDFTPEQTLRWDAWQRAYAISAQRTDHVVRLLSLVVLAAMVTAVVIAIWK